MQTILFAMDYPLDIASFLDPLNLDEISQDEEFKKGQYAHYIDCYERYFPNIELAQVVMVGCNEQRGNGLPANFSNASDVVRRHFYKLYPWHVDIRIADIGNVKTGATLNDTCAALKEVCKYLLQLGKKVLILGGSHDITLGQYRAYVDNKQLINAIVADALIDIESDSALKSENFLLDLFTAEPNYTRDYCHIGFQSYFVNPEIIETLNKLHFDFYRVGAIKEKPEEIEPIFRNGHLFSFDVNCIANAYAPANHLSSNGFSGEEACVLMQYAGMSRQLSTVGLYGYNVHFDKDELTAKQLSQMIWYYIDGLHRGNADADIADAEMFNEYHVSFSGIDTVFKQSKISGRWWMQMPDKSFVACSAKDYQWASENQYPERWLRLQEKDV